MISDYEIRKKEIQSPEEGPGQEELLDDPQKIVDRIKEEYQVKDGVIFKGDPILDFRMEISRSREREFLLKLDELLAPNSPIPHDFRRIKHLRQAIYKSGHTLMRGNGFETLEKLGFSIFYEKDRIFIICDHRVRVPESLDTEIFFEAAFVLMKYVSSELLDYSYLWSIEDKLIKALVMSGGELKEYADNHFHSASS
jgi:hypothetical protein